MATTSTKTAICYSTLLARIGRNRKSSKGNTALIALAGSLPARATKHSVVKHNAKLNDFKDSAHRPMVGPQSRLTAC